MWHWWNGTLSGEIPTYVNSCSAFLTEKSLQKRLGLLSSEGALVVQTGKLVKREFRKKFIVRDETTENIIKWSEGIQSLSSEIFEKFKIEVLKKIHLIKPELFIMERTAGAHNSYSIGLNLITPSPHYALFFKILFREKNDHNPLGNFTIFHDPDFKFDAFDFDLKSSHLIALNMKSREILIAGTTPCSEIKDIIFTLTNTILPDYGVLPIQASAGEDKEGKVSIFFGPHEICRNSLVEDFQLKIIANDELGVFESGVFNIEAGVYDKISLINHSFENHVNKQINQFGSLIENVLLDEQTRSLKFDKKMDINDGRSTHLLNEFHSRNGFAGIPSNYFFLHEDSFGVLPLIGLLHERQAIEYFFLNYFDEFLMVRDPEIYVNLLNQFLDKHPVKVWIVNTGFYGGSRGEGQRYDFSIIRSCINAVLRGDLESVNFNKDPVFSISVPESLHEMTEQKNMPHELWNKPQDYFNMASRLKALIDENYQKINRRKYSAFRDEPNIGLY